MAAFKDELGPAAVDQIAAAFHDVQAAFPHTAFRKQALAGLDQLELKARVAHLIEAIHFGLCQSCGVPDAGPRTVWAAHLEVLQSACASGLKGFVAWPLIDYVAAYGRARPSESLPALAQMTSAFSAEFALNEADKRTIRWSDTVCAIKSAKQIDDFPVRFLKTNVLICGD